MHGLVDVKDNGMVWNLKAKKWDNGHLSVNGMVGCTNGNYGMEWWDALIRRKN